MPPLRLLSRNLQYGEGRDSTGARHDRWEALAEMIRASGAHIVLLQEAAGWCEHNFQQAARAERDLGMQVPWDALEPGQSTTMPIRPLWPLR